MYSRTICPGDQAPDDRLRSARRRVMPLRSQPLLHRSTEAWRVRCWRAPALRAQAVSKNSSKCLIAPRRFCYHERTGFFIFLRRCHLGIDGAHGSSPALSPRLGNEPPTTFHCCRCASPSGAMSLHPRRSNRVIAIHRPADRNNVGPVRGIGLSRIPCVVISPGGSKVVMPPGTGGVLASTARPGLRTRGLAAR